MGITPAGASLPNLNPLGVGGLGSSPSTLSTPVSRGTGYSMADTFEAAPQRAYASAGYGSASPANAGYSSVGSGYGNAAGPAAGPAVGATGDIAQIGQEIVQTAGEITELVKQAGADIAGGAAGPVNLGNVTGDPRLLQAMQEIAQDPEGAKLAQAAAAQGLKLQVGQLPPGVMGETLNGTITISTQAMSNKPDLIHTLGHELGHAATAADGDSITEEQTVDQLGQRIQQRIAPGPTFQLNIAGYRGLPQDNGIRNTLAQIGL